MDLLLSFPGGKALKTIISMVCITSRQGANEKKKISEAYSVSWDAQPSVRGKGKS